MQKINDVKKVSILGIIINTVLLVIKLTVGIISKSQSMIADAIHSIEDSIASILSYIGAKLSYKQKDKLHPYGYNKIEYIFSFLISIIMLVSSMSLFKTIIINAISVYTMTFSKWLIIVCIINILIKFLLLIYTRKKYIKTKDILIKASMEDHRNDIFLTSGTLVSVICGYFKLNIVDFIIGIFIALRIIYISIKIFMESFLVLIDTGLDQERINMLYNKIIKHSNDIKIVDIISKPIGAKYIVILKVKAKSNINIKKLKKQVKRLKKVLVKEFEYIVDVIVDV